MADDFFTGVPGPIPFGGRDAADPLTFKIYEPDRVVLGKRMEDQLRLAVCLWHSFAWPGSDVFGAGTFGLCQFLCAFQFTQLPRVFLYFAAVAFGDACG